MSNTLCREIQKYLGLRRFTLTVILIWQPQCQLTVWGNLTPASVEQTFGDNFWKIKIVSILKTFQPNKFHSKLPKGMQEISK